MRSRVAERVARGALACAADASAGSASMTVHAVPDSARNSASDATGITSGTTARPALLGGARRPRDASDLTRPVSPLRTRGTSHRAVTSG